MVYSEHPEQRACLALLLKSIFPFSVIERVINVTLVMYMQMSLNVLLHWKRKKKWVDGRIKILDWKWLASGFALPPSQSGQVSQLGHLLAEFSMLSLIRWGLGTGVWWTNNCRCGVVSGAFLWWMCEDRWRSWDSSTGKYLPTKILVFCSLFGYSSWE